MLDHRFTRRLAAVLAADVAGYSSMMESDESATLAALRQIWVETNPSVAAHYGRIVKMMGDGAWSSLQAPSRLWNVQSMSRERWEFAILRRASVLSSALASILVRLSLKAMTFSGTG